MISLSLAVLSSLFLFSSPSSIAVLLGSLLVARLGAFSSIAEEETDVVIFFFLGDDSDDIPRPPPPPPSRDDRRVVIFSTREYGYRFSNVPNGGDDDNEDLLADSLF
jgi:hypothetical protein